MNDVFVYYDVVIVRDFFNYLILFKCVIIYFFFGCRLQVIDDFEKVFLIKLIFEGVYFQLGKLCVSVVDWDGVKFYYKKVKKIEEVVVVEVVKVVVKVVEVVVKVGNWEECVKQVDDVILMVNRVIYLCEFCKDCVFERGVVERGIVDLQYIF